MFQDKFTILISAKNSASTIKYCFDSISKLSSQYLKEIIYIDDNSNDGSFETIKSLSQNFPIPIKVIRNKIPQGLAKNYNYGLKNCHTRFLITMHQDMEIVDIDALEKTLHVFKSNNNCALVYSKVIHPKSLLQKYNFWMKVHFSRVIERETDFSAGKFDALDLNKIDFKFNDGVFKNSGEDAGFNIDLRRRGLEIGHSDVKVIHNHNFNQNYSFTDYIKKENQLNETYGVLVRNYGLTYFPFKNIIFMFHRLVLIAFLFIPVINIVTLIVLIYYLFKYSSKIFEIEKGNPNLIFVPLVNLIVIIFGAYYNIIGFIRGKQLL